MMEQYNIIKQKITKDNVAELLNGDKNLIPNEYDYNVCKLFLQ